MTAAQLIETLAARGVVLELVDGTIEVVGAELLTDAELRTLRDHRDILRRYLAANDDDGPPVTVDDLIARYGEWLIVDIDGHRHEIRTADALEATELEHREWLDPETLRREVRRLVAEGRVAAHRLHAAESDSVRCCDCRHFRRSDEHPHLGACAAGVPPTAAAGFWDTARRFCDAFTPRTES